MILSVFVTQETQASAVAYVTIPLEQSDNVK
jgi:hypothetical protein